MARNLETIPNAAVVMIADLDTHRLASLKANQPWMETTRLVEPLRLECEDFAGVIRTVVLPRADEKIGVEVVRVLARVEETLQIQESQPVVTAREKPLADAGALSV